MRAYRSIAAVDFLRESIDNKIKWLARQLRKIYEPPKIDQWVRTLTQMTDLLNKLALQRSCKNFPYVTSEPLHFQHVGLVSRNPKSLELVRNDYIALAEVDEADLGAMITENQLMDIEEEPEEARTKKEDTPIPASISSQDLSFRMRMPPSVDVSATLKGDKFKSRHQCRSQFWSQEPTFQ